MLEFTEQLTIAPSSMTEENIQALRDAGWTDRDILDIVHVCAYFNFRVRIVDGLGLKLSDEQLDRARANRTRAAELAAQRGANLPSDVWGISDELSATT